MYTLEHDKRAIEFGNGQEDDGTETSPRVRQRENVYIVQAQY